MQALWYGAIGGDSELDNPDEPDWPVVNLFFQFQYFDPYIYMHEELCVYIIIPVLLSLIFITSDILVM